jgi:hypothetical protein
MIPYILGVQAQCIGVLGYLIIRRVRIIRLLLWHGNLTIVAEDRGLSSVPPIKRHGGYEAKPNYDSKNFFYRKSASLESDI